MTAALAALAFSVLAGSASAHLVNIVSQWEAPAKPPAKVHYYKPSRRPSKPPTAATGC
jgi:hypothetical protein